MEDPIITATKDQIEEFKSSLLWNDIKRELAIWKKMAKDEYGQVVRMVIENDSMSTPNFLAHLGSLFGREATIDYMLSIPDVFLQLLEERKNDT